MNPLPLLVVRVAVVLVLLPETPALVLGLVLVVVAFATEGGAP